MRTVGWIETVSMPELGVHEALAKIDTGAFSGALHCTGIKVVRRGVVRKRYLKFVPLGQENLATETDNFQRTFIRSSTGHRMKRYVIDTEIIVQGKKYPTRIGLSDRTDMKIPILLGRRFLREHNMMVDVRVNQEQDDEGENTR